MAIKTLKEKLIFQNQWVTAWVDDVEFPSGAQGEYFRWRWNAPYGVIVAPTDGANVLLLRNHRYREAEPRWETPMGFGEPGASPESCARRELLEETGLSPTKIELLTRIGPEDAAFPEFVFLAHIDDLSAAHSAGAEDDEVITGFKIVPIEQLAPPDFSALGVTDPKTMVALAMIGAELGGCRGC